MPSMSSSIVNLYQNQLEASRQFADAIFSGTEKIDRVVIDATHRAVTEQLEFAQALAGVRDQASLAKLPSGFLPKPEDAANYQREILQVFAEMQNDIGKSIQHYVDQISSTATGSASRGTETTQSLANGAFNPMNMFSVWQSAFNKVAALANRNMQAARTNFENVANTATSAAAQAVANATETMEEESSAHHRRSTSGSKRK